MSAYTLEIICLAVAAITFGIGTLFHYKGKPELYFSISLIAVCCFCLVMGLSLTAHAN